MAMDGMISKSVQREIIGKGQKFPGSKNALDALIAAIIIIGFGLALFAESCSLFLIMIVIIIILLIYNYSTNPFNKK